MWAAGEAYEPYVGRWSRLVAAEFVRRLAAAPGGSWRDIGCGTGAVARAVLAAAAPRRVIGVDPAESYVRHARRHLAGPRADFVVGDALALPFPDGRATAAVSGLVLNFVPDPARAAAEMVRVVGPGGTVAVYLWDYGEGGMRAIRAFWDAARALDRRAEALDEAVRFPLAGRKPLRELLTGAGLAGWRPVRSPYRPGSGTSTTTGGRSWAARAPRPPMWPRCPRTTARSCGNGCAPPCPGPATARSA